MAEGLVKIFNQLYVGFQKRRDYNPNAQEGEESFTKLAFVTPYEDNAAGRKRQATVDSWANGGQYGHYEKTESGVTTWVREEKPDDCKPIIIENKMLSGFKLSREVRRTYWGGGNVVWRIEHPEGWEFEISSSNLARIIIDGGIEPGGEIPGNCIFGRCGAENVLVPETSEVWKQSIKNAENIDKSSVKTSETVVPGSVCLMKNGNTMTYVGQYFVIEPESNEIPHRRYSENCIDEKYRIPVSIIPTTTRYHVFYNEGKLGSNNLYLYREKKVVEVSSIDETWTDISVNEINLNKFNGSINYAAQNKYSWGYGRRIFSTNKPLELEYFHVDVSNQQLLDDLNLKPKNEFKLFSYSTFDFVDKSTGQNYTPVFNDGFALQSMMFFGKTESGHYDKFRKDSIKVLFTEKYRIEDSKLLVCDYMVHDRNIVKHGFEEYRVVQRYNHDNQLNEMITQALKELFKVHTFKILKVRVTCDDGSTKEQYV